MPNQLDANGLQIASLSEIVGVIGGTVGIVPALALIYGHGINVNPNTPDGQMINIIAQSIEDMLETLLDTYGIFFVDSTYGVNLDQLVALNGIARKAGSYTQVFVQVSVTQALTLPGTDTTTPFTVADAAGNQYELVESYAFAGAGTATLQFEAALLGQVQVTANTIQSIITTTLGVSSVNNSAVSISTIGTISSGFPQVTAIVATTAGMTPGMAFAGSGIPAGATILSVDSSSQVTLNINASANATISVVASTPTTITGNAEETDIQLKVRRARSFNLQTQGPADAIAAALLSYADVFDAYVAENDTSSPANNVPANSVWIIVNGGTAAEIAQAIYSKKMPGCPMKGSQSMTIARPQGNNFTAKWDNAIPQPIFIQATLNAKIPGQTFDTTSDAQELANALIYKLGQNSSIGDVILAMAVIEPNAVLSNVQISIDNSTWEDILTPSSYQQYFSVPVANITLSNA